MHNPKLAVLMVIAVITALTFATQPPALPVSTPGTQPSIIGCLDYPNVCLGIDINIERWNRNLAQALVASGSAPWGDVYNLTMLLRAAGLNPANYTDFINNNRRRVPGISIGFNQWGEFVAVLRNGVGGGIAVARFNSPTEFSQTESWVTNIIPANDWINGWAFAANITYQGTSDTYCIRVVVFATYSNRTDAGAGKGAAVNVTRGRCNASLPWPGDERHWVILPPGCMFFRPAPNLAIVLNTPRLLVARAGLSFDLSPAIDEIAKRRNWADLTGTKLIYNISYTLVFPKAFPYALIYYNWTMSITVSKFALGAWINSTAFTVRYEIDFYNGAGSPVGANMSYYPNRPMIRGRSFDYFVAASGDGRLLFFSAVYPNATEFHVQEGRRIAPLSTTGFDMFLYTGTRVPTPPTQPSTPFVIHQWKYTYRGTRGIEVRPAIPTTVSNGTLFVYGMVYNGSRAYIAMERILNATIFSARLSTYYGGDLGRYNNTRPTVWFAAGRDALPTDTLGIGYITWPLGNTTSRLFNVMQIWYFLAVDRSPMDNPAWAADTIPSLVFCARPDLRDYVDIYGRVRLKPYFNLTGRWYPVAGSIVATVGGPVVNLVTRYTHDFAWYSPFLFDAGIVVVPVWNRYDAFASTFRPRPSPIAMPSSYQGYAVISVAFDANGTTLFQVWGYTAEDTYWASYILSNPAFNDILGTSGYLVTNATVALVRLTYQFRGADPSNAMPFYNMPRNATIYFYHPVLGLVGQRTIIINN